MSEEPETEAGWIIDAMAEGRDPLIEWSRRYGDAAMTRLIEEIRLGLRLPLSSAPTEDAS